MWFRLKEDYETKADEIHSESWHIEKIKKGAPIVLTFTFDKSVKPGFIFSLGGLRHMKLSMLDLPDACVKSLQGDVYCATQKGFFYASYSYNKPIAEQLICCPLCGRKLETQLPIPVEDISRNYEVRF